MSTSQAPPEPQSAAKSTNHTVLITQPQETLQAQEINGLLFILSTDHTVYLFVQWPKWSKQP